MAVMHFVTHVDLNGNELRDALLETVDALPPAAPTNAGRVVRLASDGLLYGSTGTQWRTLMSTAAAPNSHVHMQPVPQAVVTVTHGLGYRPAVTMFSPDFSVQYVGFAVEHLDINTVRVAMDTPRACALVMS